MIYELQPTGANKSFYGKAQVEVVDGKEILYSYGTKICEKEGQSYYRLCEADIISATTSRHIKAFTGLSKAEFLKLERR